jgi:iron complex outermembrane receptor protein
MLHKFLLLIYSYKSNCPLAKFFISLSWIILLLLLFPGQGTAQGTLTIRGTVSDDTGEELPGATVELHELGQGVITDLEGRYIFTGLRPGTYHLHVTYIGYEAVDRTVRLRNSDQVENFQLHPSSIELREVLVEANPFKSGPIEQSLTIETLSREFLDRNQGNTFVNTLERLPGISSINTGVGISKPVIRGLSLNRVIVNDRGVKQEGQQWGADHGLEIDQFDPQQVEIIKGPASLIYGSDALGGVIHIRPPKLAGEGIHRGDVTGIYRSNNDLWGSSAFLEGNENGFVYNARFSALDFADYRVPASRAVYNQQVIPIYDQRLKNTAGQERNLSLMTGISKSWGYSTLTLSSFNQQAGIYPGAMAKPGEYSVVPDADYRNIDLPRQQVNHLKLISNTNIKLGPNWLEADLGYQLNNRREESEPHAHGRQPISGTLALQLRLHTLSGNLRYHHNWNGRASSIWGLQGQYQQNERDGFEFLLPDLQTASLGAYHYSEYSLGSKITLNGGLRLDYGEVNARGFRHPADWVIVHNQRDVNELLRSTPFARNYSNLSGAMGISYYPSHAFNAKLNLGKSFKIPSYAELASNGVHHGTFRHELGDSTLTSEHGYQADLNLTYHTKRLHLALTPYAYYFRDFIYLSPSSSYHSIDAQGVRYSLPEGGQVYRYRQHDAVFTGFEATAEYHLFNDLHLLASAEYVRNRNLVSSLPLPFTPPFSLFTEAEYTFSWPGKRIPKAWVGVHSRYTADQERVDRNEKPTPGYLIFGLNTGMELMLGAHPMVLSLMVQNLSNEAYFNHLSRYRLLNLPEQGRNISVQVKIPLSLKQG